MKNMESNGASGMTGDMIEEHFLGSQATGWDADAYLAARKAGDRVAADRIIQEWCVANGVLGEDEKRLPPPEALRGMLIHYFQENPGWDPSDPGAGESPLANDLHAHIADKLVEMGLAEDYGELRFYRTIDSPLDTLFGIDGFFEFKGSIITIDVTANTHKQAHKADKVIQASQLFDKHHIELVASDIATSFSRPTVKLAI